VVHQAIEQAHRLNPRLELLGHVVTRVDKRLIVHRSYERRLRDIYGTTVLRTVVPEASAFKVALACRCPVGLYSPRTVAAHLTWELSREIFNHTQAMNTEAAIA
jgi:chromosome partitioning protein